MVNAANCGAARAAEIVKRLALLDDFCCAGHVAQAAEPVL